MGISDRKFYKSVYTVTVLSETQLDPGMKLENVSYLIEEGPCSGNVSEEINIEIDAAQMAQELEQYGIAPSFFFLTEMGEEEYTGM